MVKKYLNKSPISGSLSTTDVENLISKLGKNERLKWENLSGLIFYFLNIPYI